MIQPGKLCQAHMGKLPGRKRKNATGHCSLELTIRTCAANNETLSEVPGSNNPPANLLPKARPVLKERLYLKKAIPMLVYRTERQMSGPRFKSIAIQTETQITGKGNKEYIFPMIVATLQTCGNGLCLCSKRSTCKADNHNGPSVSVRKQE